MTARILVLSVDRDDDVGYKAGVETPAIGRDACLDAAVKLGVADPEDSDTNAIFQAIKTYDELKNNGEDVEIAIISGNHMNMLEGDRRLAKLLEGVVEQTGVTECILISDGAEDEYTLPIIQSYLKVVGTVRVTIKQLPNIEGTFYIFKKLFNDPKFARKFLVPLGVFLLVGAIAALFLPGMAALLVVVGIIGVFFLIKGFGLDDHLGILWHGVVDSFQRGRFCVIAYIASVIMIIAGIIAGLMSIVTLYPNSGDASLLYNIFTFLYGSLIWFAVGALVAFVGKVIDVVQNNLGGFSRIYIFPFFTIAITLILYGAIIYFLSISPLEPFPFTTTQGLIMLISMTLGGLLLGIVGIYTRPRLHKRILAFIERRKIEKVEEEEHEKSGKPLYRNIKY